MTVDTAEAPHDVLARLQDGADAFVALRRDIHQHPELGYEEVRTSELVAERLAAWGYQVTRGLGGTGVVGQLTRGSGARRLGLRADMEPSLPKMGILVKEAGEQAGDIIARKRTIQNATT